MTKQKIDLLTDLKRQLAECESNIEWYQKQLNEYESRSEKLKEFIAELEPELIVQQAIEKANPTEIRRSRFFR